ncbi:MAG: glycosyl hydrolase [Bacteroidota bacterium]
MKNNFLWLIGICLLLTCPTDTWAQKKSKKKKEATEVEEKEEASAFSKMNLSGLKFRSIGPAITSGRVADIAMNPQKPQEYYVAVASGGVWKTVNAGTTFKPIFDSQGSYSIGCVTIDPNNSNVVWVGTGENNGQRSVAYGDGVYKSIDGGSSWKHVGLKNSEHIGKIIVHPENSDVVYVAAIGPLWSEGGERGVYKTMDGGENWELVLEIDEHTGVSDLIIDSRDPNVLYAAAHQRRRHVFTYISGGPSSTIYKTTDGGENWKKASKGLPGGDLGRIGLAISPANPEIIYAIVEAAQGKGGFYRSTNRGASWQKRGGYSTSGNYYQEIIADPIEENTVYAMDTWIKVSHDGGKTFKNVGETYKHVDNHSIWIDPQNNEHWVVGCDGGIYETWDAAATWDFKANLPVTQFYKVALDNSEPFYYVYGGTQDNFSLGGPSRTITNHGIMNQDWFITHGGDGFESQVDPKNPNIVYAQSQYGVLVRYDKQSGEEVGIQPKERKDENGYRWNWDAPLAVSAHRDGRLYFAANKVFRSDDRGNSWEVISDDLTQQINRNELKVMDRVWSMDAVAKNQSTSPYGTIVAFSESPKDEDLLIVGTDDGWIQITEDGGQNWRKVSNIVGVPERTYVNNIYASQHDENVIYAAFNHHKYGDFQPYLFKSSDKGQTWQNISNNLPERGSVYAIEEDHVDSDLLFCGTEFGVFFSNNGGEEWKQFKAGVPTIAVRDLAIQRRENDLVLGTFGRGFYVLDDYTPLRNLSDESDYDIFAIRDALQYEQSSPMGLPRQAFQGDSFYGGDNLDPVALITYYVKEGVKTPKQERQNAEAKAAKEGEDNPYPTYEELKAERETYKPQLVFTIMDSDDKVVRTITKPISAGVHRLQWDMRFASKDPIRLGGSGFYNPFAGQSKGTLVAPGTYSVSLSTYIDGEMKEVVAPVEFRVKALNNTTLPAEDRLAKVEFQREVTELSRGIQGTGFALREMDNKLKHIRAAIKMVERPMNELTQQANAIEGDLRELRTALYGDSNKSKLDIDQPPTPAGRIGWINYEQKYSTATPTATHRASLAIAKEEFTPILVQLRALSQQMSDLEKELEEADAPYTPGRALRMLNRD